MSLFSNLFSKLFSKKKEKIINGFSKAPPAADLDVDNAPDYVKPHITAANEKGTAGILLDGKWCGHGEPLFRIYDVMENGNTAFNIFLPNDELGFDERPVNSVKLISITTGKEFFIYDAGQHPASLYRITQPGINDQPDFWKQFVCTCGGETFKASVGFEIPGDSEKANDVSWFALTGECTNCRQKGFIYDHETA